MLSSYLVSKETTIICYTNVGKGFRDIYSEFNFELWCLMWLWENKLSEFVFLYKMQTSSITLDSCSH